MFSLLSLVFPFQSNNKSNDLFVKANGNQTNSLLLMNSHLIANDSSAKRSLLYQLSESVVRHHHQDIHYIVHEKMTEMPARVDQMPAIDATNGHLLEFLKMFYLPSYDSLVTHLLGIQSTQLSPMVIIVDDISYYVKQYNSRIERQGNSESIHKRHKSYTKDEKQLMAQLSALLINTGNNCGQKLNKQCLVVMGYNADHSMDTRKAQSIGHRFFTHEWLLSKKLDHSPHQTNYQIDCTSSDCHLQVDMSLKNKQFVLNQISKCD